jgi:hypothetical protein
MLHPESSPFAGVGPVGANLGDDPRFLRAPRFDIPPVAAVDSPGLARAGAETPEKRPS